MYAIVFDFDTQVLKDLYPNDSWNNAYYDVRSFCTARTQRTASTVSSPKYVLPCFHSKPRAVR